MSEFFLVAFALILIVGVYWIFILMPRQRDFVKRQQMARTLQEGDEVITAGGVVGTIHSIDAEKGVANIEIAPGLQVRVVTAAILDLYDPDEIAKNALIGTHMDSDTD